MLRIIMAVAAGEQLETRLRDVVSRLAALQRGTGSPGERAAAELIADELRAGGAEQVRLGGERGGGRLPPGVGTAARLPARPGRRALRGAGVSLSAAYPLAMLDSGLRAVVRGANDSATGCGVGVELARALAADPPPDLRVLLVSPAEESFSDGMVAFGRRHFASLPRDSTTSSRSTRSALRGSSRSRARASSGSSSTRRTCSRGSTS